MLINEWGYLINKGNFDKCNLVWRQVIGYLQRGLPAVDRFAFARGLYIEVNNAELERKFEFKGGRSSFPDTGGSEFGLGFEYGMVAEVVEGLKLPASRAFGVVRSECILMSCAFTNFWLAKAPG